MTKKLTLLFFLALSSISGHTQVKEDTTKVDLAFSPGLILQGNLFADVNILLGKVTTDFKSKIPIVGIQGFRIGFESNFRNGDNYTIAPKIGYEISPMLYTLRLSAVNYFQNGNSEFRILPELGFSLGGLVNLTYGYGIAFSNEHLNNVSNHRIALTFNLNSRLKKGTLELLKQ